MARPIRIEFSGALYHVTARGDRREAIYEDDDDRRAFLDVLGRVVADFNWVCHAYCLMTNHYHLVIETPTATCRRACASSTVCTRSTATAVTCARVTCSRGDSRHSGRWRQLSAGTGALCRA